jgi:DNA-binding transcriptional ArsR family regulator
MVSTSSIAEVAALVGDPARAAMLQALLDGRALTATELASVAGVAPQTASGHLGQLTTAGLIAVMQQGRHRYHRLATPQVARMLESVMLVAAGTLAPRTRTGPADKNLRRARTCYDHIAGRLGVAIADAMAANGWLELQEDAGLVTQEGTRFFAALGIDFGCEPRPRRARAAPLCKLCLDWSERRPHLSGRLGAAICSHSLDRGWVRKRQGSRALDITSAGTRTFREVFRIPAFEDVLACD